MESFLVEIFREDSFPSKPVVDRAHHTLRPLAKWAPASHDCTPASLLDKIQISFYPDLSIDLVWKRAAFNLVKKQLWEAGLKYSFAYPAMLRFTFSGSRHEFKSSQNASDFVRANIKTLEAPNDMVSKDIPILEE